jgi:hyperosmotically inducible periplasmic protein
MRMKTFATGLAAVALAMLVACAPTRTTKSAGEQVDDSVITAKVKTALAEGIGAGDSIRADVETFRGRVQLNGFVDSAEKKADATRIARKVQGVTAVENNLSVATAKRSAGEYVDDKVILAKVKGSFAGDATVAAHQVNVEVRQGVVQLAGFVDTSEQKSRAGKLAGDVAGVSRVDNQIEVKRR